MGVLRVLHVVGAMEYGGMENFIMNLYRNMDRNNIQFDFLTHHGRRGSFEDEIEALGGKIYHTTITDDGNMIRYRRALRALYHEHPEYKIVHGHLSSMAYWYLGEAEKQGVPWRILHSHVPSYIKSLKGLTKNAMLRLSPCHANIRFACSPEAGRYQFRSQPFEIINNCIDLSRFQYNEEKRNALRKELGLEDRFVVGHVGRFFPEKNHAFLLRMFDALQHQMDDATLLLVGGGPLFETIRQQVNEMGLKNRVVFSGLQKDTVPFYQAMDVFVLPSQYEGFPLTGIEAQCAGLPCVFTDRTTDSILMGENCMQLAPDDEAIGQWVDTLKKIRNYKVDRSKLPSELWEYDAVTVARKMADRYYALWEKCT